MTASRERLLAGLAAVAVATAGACAYAARKYAVKAGAVSEAEVEALIANARTTLALHPEVSDRQGQLIGWYVRHESPPEGLGPFFWYAAAAGGPDPRYMMAAVRDMSGWASTVPAARAALEDAAHTVMQAAQSGDDTDP